MVTTAATETEVGVDPFRILYVIPTLGKRLATIGRTLASIRVQENVLVDIVIVAKNSSAELAAAAQNYRADLLIHQGDLSSAINAGFARASNLHRYVAWLGDDDMLRPRGLAVTSDLLERHPASVVAFGACDYIDMEGRLLFSRRPPPLAEFLLQFVPGLIKQETCLFRKTAVQRVGGVSEKFLYAMDLDFLLRLRRVGSFIRSPEIIAAFCWHPGSLTANYRSQSFQEARQIQYANARGMLKVLPLLLRYPIQLAAIAMRSKIAKPSNQVHDKK